MTDSNSGPSQENRPYLGDPQVVAKLLQGIARETIQCRLASKQGVLSPEDARAIEEKEATAAARALLGRDKKYAIDANWNVPGVIDGFVKNELGVEEKAPEPVLVAGLLKFVGDVHTRLNLLENPKADPKAESQVQDIIENYRNVLLGLHFAAPAVAAAPTAPTPIPVTSVPAPAAPKAPAPAPAPAPAAAAAPKPAVSPVAAAATTPASVKKAPAEPVVKTLPTAAPAKEPAERSGGGMKWAALLILLLVIGGVVFFMMKKPSEQPKENTVAKTETPPPAPPKVVKVGAAPVLNSNGTVDLIDESGATLKTIAMKNGKKVVHIYDAVRIEGQTSLLVATEGSDDTYDLWLVREGGDERQIAPKAWDGRLAANGTRIAYTTLDHTLVVEDLDGKRIATAEGAQDFAWAPDSNSIVFLRASDGRSRTHPNALELARLQLPDGKIATLTGGFYDNVDPMVQPDGTIYVVAGSATGLPSFWKVVAAGSEPEQITNVRLDETNASWVPTPFSTAQWSANGRWLIYDYKEGSVEQIWGLEFDEKGAFKRAARITEGLVPRWINENKFVCLKNVNGSLEANVHEIPKS